MKKSRPVLAAVAALSLLLGAAPAPADPQLCERAARTAAAETGVPVDLLHAITLAETGRRHGGILRPWPWAINLGGRGQWFDTRAAALDAARHALDQGRGDFDLGCFQINWHWHGRHFPSVQALLDPLTAARYAAGFLARLRDEFGTWDAAAGAYHSRTPALAARYGARIAHLRTTRAANTPAPPPPDSAPDAPRVNGFPLLVRHDAAPAGALASLVRPAASQGPAILAGLAGGAP